MSWGCWGCWGNLLKFLKKGVNQSDALYFGLQFFNYYCCQVKLLSGKKNRADSICGFSPFALRCSYDTKQRYNDAQKYSFYRTAVPSICYDLTNKRKIKEISREGGVEHYIKKFDGYSHFIILR